MEKIVILRPKTIQLTGFVYNGLTDLADLIKFVGKTPQINANLTLNFKKQVVAENCIVFRNEYGEVTNVLPVEKVGDNFDVVKSLNFAPEHELTPVERVKVIKEKGTKSKKAPKAKEK